MLGSIIASSWHLTFTSQWEFPPVYDILSNERLKSGFHVWVAPTCSSVWLWRHLQVDFWRPESSELVTIDIDVDIHVPAMYLDMVHTLLQQSDMEHTWVTGLRCKIKSIYHMFKPYFSYTFTAMKVLYLCTILRYLYFTWVIPFSATLYFYSPFKREILNFLLHYIYFKAY